jgi:hypothetical protein
MDSTVQEFAAALCLSDQQGLDRAMTAHGQSASRSWMTSREFRRRAEREQRRLQRQQGNSASKGF